MLFCHRSRGIVASAAFVVLGFVPTMGRSATVNIVNDRWQDGDRTYPTGSVGSEYGVDSDADGDLESAWYNGGSGTATATAGVGQGHLILANGASGSSSWTTHFTSNVAPITLANTGDFIHVRWVFTPSGVGTGNTSQNFRLALVDAPAASRLTADGAPGSGAYAGYGMFMNFETTLGNSSPFRLEERAGASGALLSATGDWTPIGTTGAAAGTTGYASGTTYTFDMTITRNAASGFDIDSKMTGGSLNNTGTAQVLFTDATPNNNSFAFDTFSLRPSDGATTAASFDTTLFQVETNANLLVAPEPATLAALVGGAIILRRRRR